MRGEDPTTLTDLERAASFLYLQRVVFGGKIVGCTFGVSRSTPGRFDVTKLEPILADLHERLAGTIIEQLPYADVIDCYDGLEMFYLDPPYVDCEADCGDNFAAADFERLVDQLERILGQFVLSINDTPFARAVFGRFQIEAVPVSYSIGAFTVRVNKQGS